MKLRARALFAVVAPAILCLGVGRAIAQNAYVTNSTTDSISVINTATNKVTATIQIGAAVGSVAVSPIGGAVYVAVDNAILVINPATNSYTKTIALLNGEEPVWLAVSPDGSKLYVSEEDENSLLGSVAVIDTATDSIIATVDLPEGLWFMDGIVVSPDGSKVYAVADGPHGSGAVSVIDTATNTIIAEVESPLDPGGAALTPDGSKLYVVGIPYEESGNGVGVIDTATDTLTTIIQIAGGSFGTFALAVTPDGTKLYVGSGTGDGETGVGTVSVIDIATDSVLTSIPFGNFLPAGLAITPEGSKVYVANRENDTVAVIDTTTNSILRRQITVGGWPVAFGNFIIRPSLAGTPGDPTCRAQTVAALAVQFGSLDGAVTGLGFYNIETLRGSIRVFCANPEPGFGRAFSFMGLFGGEIREAL